MYAKVHTFNGNQKCISARQDQPDSTWTAYSVPNADWLSLDANGNIVVSTVDPAIAKARQQQSSAISTSCKLAIESGFISSALGAAHTYGCNATDQNNINMIAVGGGSLWCADSAGAWVFTAHAIAQAAQVQKDMVAHIQTAQSHYAALLAQIAAAQSVAAVQAVVW